MLDAHIKTKGMKEPSLVSLFAQMDALEVINADIMSFVLQKNSRICAKMAQLLHWYAPCNNGW